MKEKDKLCVVKEKYGTVDVWICPEGFPDRVVITYNGAPVEERSMDMPVTVEALENFMGVFGRDIENWGFKDLVIHWGVHTWKFCNCRNMVEVSSMDEIHLYSEEIEWH